MILTHIQVFFTLTYLSAMLSIVASVYVLRNPLHRRNARNLSAGGSYSQRTFGDSLQRRIRSARVKTETNVDSAYCKNGGTLLGNNRCECVFPFTGRRCLDYACVHGISVGARYDPDSLFFNKPCICDEDWIGELCDVPTADQCNDRGEFRDGHCHCIGYFFGSQCQYVSRCEHGKRKYSRCICEDGWQGDYCHEIICQHGYPDTHNGSQSCICPARFTGTHCDRCAQYGPKIQPYPDCTIRISQPKARVLRQETDSQIRSRMLITVGACSLLLLLVITMFILHQRRLMKMRKSPYEESRRRELEERQNMLEQAAISMDHISNEERLLRMAESKLASSSQSITTKRSQCNER
uniref:EGF-like domain-containing protein n=1 Tax=Parascaris univalens TaxID=6257 RepID=A0A914ZFR1_PARUN